MRSVSKLQGQRSGSFTETARREQIVAGAIVVLAEKGYGATSLGAIADYLDVSKGVISYHFAGKAEVLNEVVRTVLGQAEVWMSPRIAAAASFTEALRLYIESNLTFLDTHRIEIFALTEVLSNARATPGIAETFGQSRQSAIAALEALFSGGRNAGEFDDFSARVAAISLRAAIDAVTGLIREDPEFDLSGYGADLATLYERASAL
jgi:AcrR family transcriptional regulator